MPVATARRLVPISVLTLAFTAAGVLPLPSSLDALAAGRTPHPVAPHVRQDALRPVDRTDLVAGDASGVKPGDGAVSGPDAAAPSASRRGAERGQPGRGPERGRDAVTGAMSAVVPVDSPVGVVGVTWPHGALGSGDTVQVRVRHGATWAPWEPLSAEPDEHGPDPGSAEARRAAAAQRDGTDPYVVTGDAVQARVLRSGRSAMPGVSISVVDPGTSDADPGVATSRPGAASAASTRPTIYTRAQWGADESLRTAAPQYAQVHLAYVHHTAGSNTYTQSQVPAIIRGIYAYHVKSNGWSDIGYNFLVDKFGRTWEGRYGGVDKAVIGAHTLGHNSYSFGVAAIGTFQTTAVPSAVTTALTNLIAWKLSLYGMPATGTVFAKDKYFNRISGHRDAYGTECPGAQLYAKLPAIRAAASARMGTLRATTIDRDVDRAGQTDVLSYQQPAAGSSTTGPVTLHRSAARDPLRWPGTVGGNWNTVRLATLAPDLTGDGRPDVIAQYPAGDNLRVYAGDGAGGVARMVSSGTGWSPMKALIPVPDLTGDGANDLLAIGSTGALALYPGTGRGTFGAGRVVGTGFAAYSSVQAAGDLTGDGRIDLSAVRSSDGALVALPGQAGGTFGSPVKIGNGWGGLSPVVAAGDVDRDGHPDWYAREPGGALRLYYGDSADRPNRWNRWGRGWQAMAQLSGGQDFTGDGVPDLLGVATTISNGTLRVYAGTGQRDFTSTSTLPVPSGADTVLLLGDVNGDGYVDGLARVGDGLVALPGRAGGTFGPPVTVATKGWAVMPKLAAGADQDYDGVPDLLATSRSGLILRYALRRDFTLKPVVELEQGWGSVRSFTGAGSFNADANGDVVALTSDGTLQLWRGSGDAPLLDYTVLRSGQTDLTQVLGVGDYNGDGQEDVLALDSAGRTWLYGGKADGTLWPGRQPLTGLGGGILG